MTRLAIRLVPVEETTLLIALVGELDVTTAPLLAALLAPLPHLPTRHVIVAAQDLRFCDLHGLGQLTRSHRALRARDGHLVIAAPPPALRRLIALTARSGEPTVPLYAGVAAALSARDTAPAPRPGHRPNVRTLHANRISSIDDTRPCHRHHLPPDA